MKSVSADAFGRMEKMANLNLRIWGTFEDREGMTQVVDSTYENVGGLFASTFKYDGENCEQNTATIGTIEPMNWAKLLEIMVGEAGLSTFMKAVAWAMNEYSSRADTKN
jgi:hypothetical protein